MKSFYLLAFMVSISFTTLAQLPITYYAFENNSNHNLFENAANMAVNTGNTAFTSNGGVLTNSTGPASLLGGSTSGKAIAFYQNGESGSTDPKQTAASYLQFKVNSNGFKGIGMKFNVYPNSYNSPYYGISYSTNGTTWTFGGSYGTPGAGNSFPWNVFIIWPSWESGNFNFPAAADNQSNLYIRIYTYHAGAGGAGAHIRFDNIQITALSTVAGTTKTMLDDRQIYANSTSGGLLDGVGGLLDGLLNLERTKFTIDGANTNISIPYLDLRSTADAAGNLTVSPNATLNISSGSNTFYVDSAKGAIPAAAINILAGAVVKLNNTLVCNGTINLQGGTLNLNNQKLQLGGTITRTTGSINAVKGTIEFTGKRVAQTISGNFFIGKNIDKLISSNPVGLNISATLNDTLKVIGSIGFGDVNNAIINTGNNLTLTSTAAATAGINDLTNAGANIGNQILGKAIVERFVSSGRKWRMLSIATTGNQTFKQAWQENAAAGVNPAAGYGMQISDYTSTWSAKGFDSYSAGGPSVKTFSSSLNTWVGINATSDTISKFNTYMCYVRGNRTSSTANTINSQAVLRTNGVLKQGTQAAIVVPSAKYVAIGNPYAAAIDLRKITKTGVQDFFYVWDPKLGGSYGLGAYQTFTKAGSNYIVVPGGGSYGAAGSVNNFIQSGQGFLVKGAAGGSVTFKETSKAIDAATATTAFAPDMSQVLRATLYTAGADTLIADGCMVDFAAGNSSDVDDEDALKIANGSENMSIKSSNQLLSVERRSEVAADDTIALSITGYRYQAYQLSLNLENMDAEGRIAFLLDSYTNSITALEMNGDNLYNFVVNSTIGTSAANRFKIVFKQAIVLPVNLTFIAANRINHKTVSVVWHSENEISLAGYTVERSSDGHIFTAIATAAPKAVNSAGATYQVADDKALPGVAYYRVKAMSIGGKIQYSATVKVDAIRNASLEVISVYPNPVADKKMNITFTNKSHGVYSLQLMNAGGQVALSTQLNVSSDNFVKTILLNQTTPAGIYTLKTVAANGTIFTTQLIVE